MSNQHPHFAPYNLSTKHICESVVVWTDANNNFYVIIVTIYACCLPYLKLYIFVIQIEMMGLPPHTTHILQPLDVGVFNHIKKAYNELSIELGLRATNSMVTKADFHVVWNAAVKQSCTPSVVQSAFRRSGLFPFDPCAIDDSKVIKRQYVQNIVKID